jgi:hypothetical protein
MAVAAARHRAHLDEMAALVEAGWTINADFPETAAA